MNHLQYTTLLNDIDVKIAELKGIILQHNRKILTLQNEKKLLTQKYNREIRK